ncbi:MAG: DinB family protein, partial [Tepidiformaceae bacterium]
MDDTTRTDLLQRYRDGYAAVTEALSGITPAQLDARSGPDSWSAREVIHHLADSEMTSAIRIRQTPVAGSNLVSRGRSVISVISRLCAVP